MTVIEQTPHSKAEAILGALSETFPTPLWRESIADKLGLTVPVVSAALDEMKASGVVCRVPPRQNDEWALTRAGDYAARLLARPSTTGGQSRETNAPKET
jgi:DNA-binding Lrp family transcriptional regulator